MSDKDDKKPKVEVKVISLDGSNGDGLSKLLNALGLSAVPGIDDFGTAAAAEGITLEGLLAKQDETLQKIFRQLLPIVREELSEIGPGKLGFFKYAYHGASISMALKVLSGWVDHKIMSETGVPRMEIERQSDRMQKKIAELLPEIDKSGKLKADSKPVPLPNVRPATDSLN